jgi:DNA-binding transcriptional ArsR family regulator
MRVAETFGILAEPTRRRILDLLRERERTVNELAERLGMSQPGVSKHLKVLREAGLVTVRHDAQRRWYELCVGPLAEIDEWLRPYRRIWTDEGVS